MKASIWKWLILVVATAWSVALIAPPKEKVKLGLDLQGGTSYTLEIDDTEGIVGGVSDARDRAVEVVRNRVDSMGVAEPTIYPDGDRRIIVQIPGMKAEDRERASANIRKAAYLEFRMVHPKNDDLIRNLFADRKVPEGYEMAVIPGRTQGDAWVRKGPPPTEAERAALRRFEEKAGYDLLLEKVTEQGKDYFVPHYVSRKAELTGDSLKSANVDYQQFGQRVVQISFDARGRKKFAQLTADHAPGGVKNPDPNGRHYLGIVLDNTLYSAPFIRTSIPGGEAIIEGSFTLEEARDLALVLRAGALPAPLRVIEERSVDPTLGVDSIQSGWRAAGLGFVAVALFMVVYYRFAGFVAVLALLFNLILLPLGMIITGGFFGLIGGAGGLGSSGVQLPVLTLPGIAGIVLTVGMAVDANVLIFERIREEMRLGKRFGAAISAGYDKAFSTIFDSNLTTLLTAVILFWMGSGPVKGFAVTLTAGIIASMYTAIVGTRMVFDFLEGHGYLNKLTMTQWVKETKVDFMAKRWVAGIASLVIIAGSLAVAVHRGSANFGVDFTGGQQLTLDFVQKAEVDTLRAALAGAGLTDVGIQYQRSGTTEKQNEVLALKVAGPEAGALAQQVLAEQFADSKFKLLQEDTVGPQVGRELQRSGLIAIGLSLVGMILYITIRFEFSFAVGAVAGLLHNLLITIGLYCVFQRQFSTTTIAALLTVLGYSVNDTIVVFDRIRETRKLRAGRLDAGIVNESVNATLSRTLLTSLTTLLSVVMLLVFGGGAIFDFALALFIGVVAGTYSSIFIASPIMLAVRPRVALAPAGK
ncbi:MAG TPA: protein translocase subunit SecD [Kiritimatiellia bacterium]|nr:protein translocase subunit SecD [Kiritimatiellia bacterium]MBP9572519.1 protein translocase subunit SecD [Kiritimatiellia bacterium]HOE00597.1 protein translocase subunit SecD [Kiritimatiellia bacterium]HOE36724.1 protein translocase subunit SecD [Kiritimatiellia bacterium]HOR74276.1 protein translocase subunit SecD [Kiritimatiellia bacterium]